MIITDAQVHLWGPNTAEEPWVPEGAAHAHRPIPLEGPECIAEMDRAGVSRAVIVPPYWAGRNNAHALRTVAAYPDRFGVMGAIDTASQRSVDLDHWLDQPGMLGARVTFYSPTSVVHVDDGSADWFFSGANAQEMPVMIYAPGRGGELGAIAERYPQIRFIIDHLNFRTDLRTDQIPATIDDLLPLAAYPNVAVKVSSLPCAVDESYPFPTLHPHIERVVRTFGADRCMWGSDFSRLPCSYDDWVRTLTEAVTFLSAEELELLMGGTIANWLRWPVASALSERR